MSLTIIFPTDEEIKTFLTDKHYHDYGTNGDPKTLAAQITGATIVMDKLRNAK